MIVVEIDVVSIVLVAVIVGDSVIVEDGNVIVDVVSIVLVAVIVGDFVIVGDGNVIVDVVAVVFTVVSGLSGLTITNFNSNEKVTTRIVTAMQIEMPMIQRRGRH